MPREHRGVGSTPTPRRWLAQEQEQGGSASPAGTGITLDIPASGFQQPVEEEDDASHQHKGAPRTPQTAAREAALEAAAGTTRDASGCASVLNIPACVLDCVSCGRFCTLP
jgi:hypothetical protein